MVLEDNSMNKVKIPTYTAENPNGMLERKFIVKKEQTNLDGVMNPSDLLRKTEKITLVHMNQYGMNRETFEKEQKLWVIVWNSLQIKRLPHLAEEIVLKVWAGSPINISQVRKYAFYTLTGEPLASVASMFMLMDKTTRTVATPIANLKKIPILKVNGEPEPPKMTIPFSKELSQIQTRVVQPEEIDINEHMNNTCYLDWVMDLLTKKEQTGYTPQNIWIKYIKELKVKEEALIHYQWEDNVLYVKGSHNGNDSFMIRAEFRNN